MENNNQIDAAQIADEQVMMPEGYGGEDFFDEQKSEQAEQPETAENEQDEQVGNAIQYDFRSELAALLEHHPALKEKMEKGEGLPGEVISECLKNGTGLRAAYAEYEAGKAWAEAEQMRRENEILKQNAAAAAKAPVTGAANGYGITNEGTDPFLVGFLSND